MYSAMFVIVLLTWLSLLVSFNLSSILGKHLIFCVSFFSDIFLSTDWQILGKLFAQDQYLPKYFHKTKFWHKTNIWTRQIFAQVGVCKDLPCLLLPWIGSTLVPSNNTIYLIPIISTDGFMFLNVTNCFHSASFFLFFCPDLHSGRGVCLCVYHLPQQGMPFIWGSFFVPVLPIFSNNSPYFSYD